MIKFFTKRLNNAKGFTLIELVVVIAILGILAAIAIPRISGFRDTARAQVNKQTAAQIKSAVAMAVAAGEIEVDEPAEGEDGTVTLYIESEDDGIKLTIESGGSIITPKKGDDILEVIRAYVDEITIEKLAVATQRIEVTIDKGGRIEAKAVNIGATS